MNSMPVLGLPCLHGLGRLHEHDHDVSRKWDVEHVAELPVDRRCEHEQSGPGRAQPGPSALERLHERDEHGCARATEYGHAVSPAVERAYGT